MGRPEGEGKNSDSFPAPHQPHLAGTDGTPVFFQSPHLPIALQPSFVGAVTRAGGPRGTEVEAPAKLMQAESIPTGMGS